MAQDRPMTVGSRTSVETTGETVSLLLGLRRCEIPRQSVQIAICHLLGKLA